MTRSTVSPNRPRRFRRLVADVALAIYAGLAVYVALSLVINPSADASPGVATLLDPATTTTVSDVGLIPAACATVDAVNFPCPAGTVAS